MPEVEHIGLPWSDDGPVVTENDAVRARLRALIMTDEGSDPVRPDYGTAIAEAAFDYPTFALETALRVHIRNKARIFVPEVFIPLGEGGGQFNQPTNDGKATFTLRYYIIDSPVDAVDELEVRLQGA